MTVEYQKLLNALSNRIDSNYKNIASILSNDLKTNLNLRMDSCAERSIAYYSTYFIENYLKSLGNECICINENKFWPCYKINSSIINKAKDESSVAKVKTKGKYFIPDATLLTGKSLYFIEYKVYKEVNHFYDLAGDYYKYKLYTAQSKSDTKFIYISFNNVSGFPNLRKPTESDVKIQFIDKKIDPTSIDLDARVYINDDSLDSDADSTSYDGDLSEYESLTNITSTIDKLIDSDKFTDLNEIINYEENVFVRNKDSYTPKVMTAYIIRKNYPQIKKVYNSFNNKDFFDQSFNKISSNEIDPNLSKEENYILWSSRYFKNEINYICKDMAPANEFLYKNIRNKSVYIIYLIEYYCKKKNLDYHFVYYKDKEEIKQNDTSLFDLLESKYSTPQAFNKLATLIESMIYFIVNLFSVMFKESSDGNDLEKNDEYILYEEKQKLIDSLKTLNKTYKFIKKVEWNNDFKQIGIDIFLKTIKKFYGNK